MKQHARPFSARTSRAGDGVHIILTGELDMVWAPLVEREVRRAATGDSAAILIDFSGLTFCDLAGQRALLRAVDTGARLVGTPPPCITRLFSLTGHTHVLPWTGQGLSTTMREHSQWSQ